MSHASIKSDELDFNKIKTEKSQQNYHQTSIRPAEGFQLKETRLAVHKISKSFFGRIVPYYTLCVEGLDDKKAVLQSVDIPVARFTDAIERMRVAYVSEAHPENEDFSHWGARKGYPFFTEMLEDLLTVGPDDLPQLLNVDVDHDPYSNSGLKLV